MERIYKYSHKWDNFTITIALGSGITILADDNHESDGKIWDAYCQAHFTYEAFHLYNIVWNVIHAGGGEISSISSAPQKYIDRVVQALNEFEDREHACYHPDLALFMKCVQEEIARIRRPSPKPSPEKQKNSVNRNGYVYLLQSPTSAYKIGRTKDPSNRAATFAVALPFEVEFIALIPADDMHALERELHNMFADKRVNGEWFNLAPDDVEYIKSLAVSNG